MAVKGSGGLTPDTQGSKYWVTPPDLATIYNFNPAFNADISGQGQTIYVIEDSDLYTANDWSTFRAGFGLSGYSGASLTTIHPGNCTDPGVGSGDGEAIIDTEYASAAAPSAAAIVVARCAATGSTGGVLIAVQNVVNAANPPAIVSISYGECEAASGATLNAAFYTAYQTGVAGGMSIFVSAGDQASSGCERALTAYHGIGVNGHASTPYNVAVGGTDFSDTYSGTNSTYWNSTNTSSNGSAKSYIPEIPWNTTCGSQLFATYEGYSTTYGTNGFCNSNFVATTNNGKYLEDWGGSGGPSACATGTPTVTDVVSGTCAGYAKPSWQSGVVGIPNDGVRDLPDVSLFASFGPWNHGYVICFSDVGNKGTSCDGTTSGWSYDWGGTSFASPIMAGVQALINQRMGEKQGNPNYRLYQLAAGE
jgi:subtilase family serine protease